MCINSLCGCSPFFVPFRCSEKEDHIQNIVVAIIAVLGLTLIGLGAVGTLPASFIGLGVVVFFSPVLLFACCSFRAKPQVNFDPNDEETQANFYEKTEASSNSDLPFNKEILPQSQNNEIIEQSRSGVKSIDNFVFPDGITKDLLVHIFSFMSFSESKVCLFVNKLFNSCFKENLFWKNAWIKEFPYETFPEETALKSTFKKLYSFDSWSHAQKKSDPLCLTTSDDSNEITSIVATTSSIIAGTSKGDIIEWKKPISSSSQRKIYKKIQPGPVKLVREGDKLYSFCYHSISHSNMSTTTQKHIKVLNSNTFEIEEEYSHSLDAPDRVCFNENWLVIYSSYACEIHNKKEKTTYLIDLTPFKFFGIFSILTADDKLILGSLMAEEIHIYDLANSKEQKTISFTPRPIMGYPKILGRYLVCGCIGNIIGFYDTETSEEVCSFSVEGYLHDFIIKDQKIIAIVDNSVCIWKIHTLDNEGENPKETLLLKTNIFPKESKMALQGITHLELIGNQLLISFIGRKQVATISFDLVNLKIANNYPFSEGDLAIEEDSLIYIPSTERGVKNYLLINKF